MTTAAPRPCDREIFTKGKGICIFHAGSAVTERWVKAVAAESGQRVDWHYSGGIVNVLFIGDYERVRAAIEYLRPALDADCKKTAGYPAEHFSVLAPESHGLYRKGDELR